MVRNYKSKNAFDKGSKLTGTQTIIILKGFFQRMSEGQVAKFAETSARTVANKFDAINERILADKVCRDALIRYLSPELEQLQWISDNIDFANDQEFWTGLHACLFECPAAIEPSITLDQIYPYKALANMTEATVEHGVVTMLKIQCAACPIANLRKHVVATILMSIRRYLEVAGQTSERQVRRNFWRSAFCLGLALRAGAMKEKAEDVDKSEAYRRAVRDCNRDLTVILARHLQLKPLNA